MIPKFYSGFQQHNDFLTEEMTFQASPFKGKN